MRERRKQRPGPALEHAAIGFGEEREFLEARVFVAGF